MSPPTILPYFYSRLDGKTKLLRPQIPHCGGIDVEYLLSDLSKKSLRILILWYLIYIKKW